MSISWVDFSITSETESVKPFSLSLETGDFLFLAGETCGDKLLLALAGFMLPENCNFAEAIRINGQRIKGAERLRSMLLPGNAIESFPPHRTIGQFALDLSLDFTKKRLESYAAECGISRHILHSKPAKIPEPVLQKISLWLCSLSKSSVIFVEEPSNGFFDEIRPFDFLQGLLKNGITESIVYLTENKETILQKAKIMQFCRARLAIFCADRLVEEGEAIKILENPVHSYTREWLSFGSSRQLKNGALWQYCHPSCPEQNNNCQVKQNVSYVSWDCEPDSAGLHKVICKGFFNL
jgi:ABC-type dipeptide/oligopeptide/nickel transport system ATPase component